MNSHQTIGSSAGNLTAQLLSGDDFGSSSASLGDLNGDGVLDIVVGAEGDDNERGAIYVLFLNEDGTCISHQKINGTMVGLNPGYEYYSRSGYYNFGRAVDNVGGDLNGDEVIDVIVGAFQDNNEYYETGSVYVLFLNQKGLFTSYQKITKYTGNFTAELRYHDYFGTSVSNAGGDLNGDSILDVMVGASGHYESYYGEVGTAYILFLDTGGTCISHQRIGRNAGGFTADLQIDEFLGRSCGSIGDLNRDGILDVAVGATGHDLGSRYNVGVVYVLFLNMNGTCLSHQQISYTQGGLTADLQYNEYFGRSVAHVASLGNGFSLLGNDHTQTDSGLSILLVGAYGHDTKTGALYILYLDVHGICESHRKISSDTGEFTGSLEEHGHFGTSVTSMDGDLNKDGMLDYVVTRSGKVYIIFAFAVDTFNLSSVEGCEQQVGQDGTGECATSGGDLITLRGQFAPTRVVPWP